MHSPALHRSWVRIHVKARVKLFYVNIIWVSQDKSSTKRSSLTWKYPWPFEGIYHWYVVSTDDLFTMSKTSFLCSDTVLHILNIIFLLSSDTRGPGNGKALTSLKIALQEYTILFSLIDLVVASTAPLSSYKPVHRASLLDPRARYARYDHHTRKSCLINHYIVARSESRTATIWFKLLFWNTKYKPKTFNYLNIDNTLSLDKSFDIRNAPSHIQTDNTRQFQF